MLSEENQAMICGRLRGVMAFQATLLAGED
jgi:hypothetical protein